MARYEKGRKCLVLFHPGEPALIGDEVFLGEIATKDVHNESGSIYPSGMKFWRTDPPLLARREGECWVFREAWLLPLDDGDSNKEI